MKLLLAFVVFVVSAPAMVIAQVPTIPPTYEPTTTYPPTNTPTKVPIPAPVPFRPCYTNLTEIEAMVVLKNPFIVETYTLCPNTVYEMGFVDPITFQYTNGSKPIYTRSNSIFQCGADGKSSNNCVIRGGEYHVYHEYTSFNREIKHGVVMKGITFEDAGTAGILLDAPGDITFTDCIFRNHKNKGVMPIVYSYSNSRRLSTILAISEDRGDKSARIAKHYTELLRDPVALAKYKVDAKKSHQRRLQGGDKTEMQSVTLDGCLFEGNKMGPDSRLTIDGMIAILTDSNEITIKNTIFQNNDFKDPINGANGYALSAVEGVKVSIMDTCFTNNYHEGAGIVIVNGVAEMLTSSGNFGSIDPELECEFARVNGNTCVDFDATKCMAKSSFVVTPATGAPINTLVDTPIAAPVDVKAPITAPIHAPLTTPHDTQVGAPIDIPTAAPVIIPVGVGVPANPVAPCNICGEGNFIQNRIGVVEFVYEGIMQRNNCGTWQVIVRNPNVISDSFCRNEMLQYTKDVCRCTSPEGILLSDIASPTTAPTVSSVNTKIPATVPLAVPVDIPIGMLANTPLAAPASIPMGMQINAPLALPGVIPIGSPATLPLAVPAIYTPNTSPNSVPVLLPSPMAVPVGKPIMSPNSNSVTEPVIQTVPVPTVVVGAVPSTVSTPVSTNATTPNVPSLTTSFNATAPSPAMSPQSNVQVQNMMNTGENSSGGMRMRMKMKTKNQGLLKGELNSQNMFSMGAPSRPVKKGKQKKMTIGGLINDSRVGFHHENNETENELYNKLEYNKTEIEDNDVNESDNEDAEEDKEEGKYPKIHSIWMKFLEGVGLDEERNSTMIGSKLSDWFLGNK